MRKSEQSLRKLSIARGNVLGMTYIPCMGFIVKPMHHWNKKTETLSA